MDTRSFAYRVLQTGALPLRPDETIDDVEHVCTSVLVWPEGDPPSAANTIVTDPCFTRRGLEEAQSALGELGLTLADIGAQFLTHTHHDHVWNVPLRTPPEPP